MNPSQARDPRFWKKWRLCGAVKAFKEASFAEIRQSIPTILIFTTGNPGTRGEVKFLVPGNIDCQYEQGRRYSKNCIEGEGTRLCPYGYSVAAPVSPHYAIIDLWFEFRKQAESRPIFIQVNGWLLRVLPQGVEAENGGFTKIS